MPQCLLTIGFRDQRISAYKKLFAYKSVTVVYGIGAALIAWLGNISSVLGLVLLGFAMVVPPAVAVGFVLYWRRTSERAAFWGMALGFAGGLIVWLFNSLFGHAENATAGGLAQWWFELMSLLANGVIPRLLRCWCQSFLYPY